MKFSIPITCDDCAEFLVDVNGTQLPKDAQCPECSKTIWLVEPLGNIVGMAIMHRAATELAGGDSTLTIVLAAMAVGIHRHENAPERSREDETQFSFRLLKVDFSEVHNPISFVEKPFHEEVLR